MKIKNILINYWTDGHYCNKLLLTALNFGYHQPLVQQPPVLMNVSIPKNHPRFNRVLKSFQLNTVLVVPTELMVLTPLLLVQPRSTNKRLDLQVAPKTFSALFRPANSLMVSWALDSRV